MKNKTRLWIFLVLVVPALAALEALGVRPPAEVVHGVGCGCH